MTVTASAPTTVTNPLFDLLSALATCLCAQIVVDGSPDVCFCGVVPGGAASQDYTGDCDHSCGMAWVRLSGMYPMAGVGIADATPGNCSASLGADIELGIMRCISVGDSEGNPPPPAELLASTQLQMADAMTMLRAIQCCPAVPTKDTLVGAYAPLGPEGGLVGGVLTLSVAL